MREEYARLRAGQLPARQPRAEGSRTTALLSPVHRILNSRSAAPRPSATPCPHTPPKPHLSVQQSLASAVPRSQDHQVFTQHKFGTFLVPKEFMNTKKSAADATVVATKQAAKHAAKKAAKKAAKQAAAEQTEAKQTAKMEKKAAAEDKAAVVAAQVVSAGDAVPAAATKEEATVQIWPGLATVTVPHQLARPGLGWATAGLRLGYGWAPPVAIRPHPRTPLASWEPLEGTAPH